MTYSNPIATIASIGASNTPIPVVIESVNAPTSRPNNVPLRQGDIWWEPVNKIQYLYLSVDEAGGPGWQPVAGEGFISLINSEVPEYTIPPATGTTIGGVIVGPGLDVTTDGTLTLEPNEDFQNITVHESATLHTITTGADVTTGVAINASAGEITAKWLNIGNNPTPDTSDVNYGVGLRTTGKIICGEIVPTSVTGAGSVVANTVNVSILSGARQGLVYKLQAGDGMTFEGSIHSHIGGTVGNDYHTNVGTLGVNNTVLRNTGTQTINGDLNMTSAGAAAGSINMNTIKFKLNYGNGGQIGAPDVGRMAFINNAPAYANGTEWLPLTGGNSSDYTLPPATANTLGGIKVGDNLSIDGNGILTANCLDTSTGGTVTQGNIILEDGYFRANRAATDDVVIEGRQSGNLNYLVMASGSVAIGGIIDESATQANTNIFLKYDGSSVFKQTMKINNPSSGQTVIQLGSAGLFQATGGVNVGGLVGAPNTSFAADGSATIGNDLTVTNGNILSGGSNNLTLTPGGNVQLEGTVLIGPDLPGTANITLDEDGSAEFANGAVDINANGAIKVSRTGDTDNCFIAALDGTETAIIEADGSAEFKDLQLTTNFADAAAAGSPDLGRIVMVAGAPYFGDGTSWKEITLGASL